MLGDSYYNTWNFLLEDLRNPKRIHRRFYQNPKEISTEFLETQIDDEELKNSILSIKRQIFLIQNLVNEFSNFARMPRPIFKKICPRKLVIQFPDPAFALF